MSERLGDRPAQALGGALALDVRGEQRAVIAGQHVLDGADDGGAGGVVTQMFEHHRAAPDLADRIGDALAGDVRGAAVDRFEQAGELALGIDVGRGRDADGAGTGRAEVGKNVSEQVAGDNHVEPVRVQHENHVINLAVNLSRQSLNDRTLTAFLREEFDKWQVKPQRLVVEVTETAAVTDFTSARGVLEEIRRLGCKVALDDFGVGFSSFYYLGQLPSDYIKIDGSFITTLLDSEESRLIVKAIADIARGLGKKTVAEFVDKPSVLPFLTNYNIDYTQGFYFGKPMLASDAGFG